MLKIDVAIETLLRRRAIVMYIASLKPEKRGLAGGFSIICENRATPHKAISIQ
jgi:hypothetical protein